MICRWCNDEACLRYPDDCERIQLRELCELIAAFSEAKLREDGQWILADAVHQARDLLRRRIAPVGREGTP